MWMKKIINKKETQIYKRQIKQKDLNSDQENVEEKMDLYLNGEKVKSSQKKKNL